MRKNIAVILAAGSGTRVGEGLPKQFRQLTDGMTVLETCVAQFENNQHIDETVIVTNPAYIAVVQQQMLAGGWQKVQHIINGGETRAESSLHAVNFLNSRGEDVNILIHDAARPFVSQRIIDDVCSALNTYEAVTVAVPCTDTIYATAADRTLVAIPQRDTLMRAQTPQAFRLTLMQQACQKLTDADLNRLTDDTSILHITMPDTPIYIVQGDETNRKITFKEDLI